MDSIMPLLSVLQQPAFFLHQDGTVASNPSAGPLSPCDRGDLPRWLGDSLTIYEQWDRQTALTLSVPLGGQSHSVTVQAMDDGDLFLLSCDGMAVPASGFLGVSSQILRESLSDLLASTQTLLGTMDDLENSVYQAQAASMTRNLFRLTRLAGNLSDYERLEAGELRPALSLLSLSGDIGPVLEDLAALVSDTGSSMTVRLPREQVQIYADLNLLERAFLNLLSNALKHGRKQQELVLQADVLPNAILFRLQNQCDPGDQDLLSAAFQRTTQRGLLPDPRWGLGLGLPLVREIARLHGGTVALEAKQDGTVIVTLSVSRKRPAKNEGLASSLPMDSTGGLDRRLIELSEVLPASVFDMQLL